MAGGIDDVVEKAKKLASVVMQVTVISPEASMFDGEADAVVAPAFDGEVGILPNHAPFMTLLGVDIRFSEQWAIRASGGLGDIEGVGVSIAYLR